MSDSRLSDEDLTVLVERGAAGSWASTFGSSTDTSWDDAPATVKNSYRESILPAMFHGTKALRELGWVKPRIVTTVEELNLLPAGSVILGYDKWDGDQIVSMKRDGEWLQAGTDDGWQADGLIRNYEALRVLHGPGAAA